MSAIPKLCADFLRSHVKSKYSQKLKASHAHELVAAFFGYKSNASLLADEEFPLTALSSANVLVPNIELMELRVKDLKGFPSIRCSEEMLAEAVSEFLIGDAHYAGEVWLCSSLQDYVTDVLLFEKDWRIMDLLSGVMAETNAEFSSFPQYEGAVVEEDDDVVQVTVQGIYDGEQLDDKPYSGDTISFEVTVTLSRVAGRCGFHYHIDATGSVDEEFWGGPDEEDDEPTLRPKDQFLEMTGGFRFDESPEDFRRRQDEAQGIRDLIAGGAASISDIDRLSVLLGKSDHEY